MRADASVVDRLRPGVRRVVQWLMSRWLGRFAMRTATACVRIELFDRSMAIAAQVFTSVFPILIVLGSWLHPEADTVADNLGVPDDTKAVIDQAVGGASTATVGIVGAAILLISATSLARALTRAYAAIWSLPRPKARLSMAWRWLAAVLALAISLIVVRRLIEAANRLPPPDAWGIAIAFATDVAVGLLLPWLLLARLVRIRMLVPGALLYATAMVPVRLASHLWFPERLESSATRYGTIGVAFTYIAWLYVAAFCFLAANVVGNVLATDGSGLGRWIRGKAMRQRLPSGSSVALMADERSASGTGKRPR